MIIIGAKGFAKEVLQIFYQTNNTSNLYFFDDVNKYKEYFLYGKFKIINNFGDVKSVFGRSDNFFTLGIGNSFLRYKLANKFIEVGGELSSTISPYANIGAFGNIIEKGCNIMTGTVITNDVHIEKGVLINLNCTIGHDSQIGKFTEICPGVHISGRVEIGKFSFIGTGSVILPNIKIGDNTIIGAGSVVTKDAESNSLYVGAPAKKVKDLEYLKI